MCTVVENHGNMGEKTALRDIAQRKKDKIPVVCASEGILAYLILQTC